MTTRIHYETVLAAVEINGGVTAHKIYSLDDDWTMSHETARLLITPITPYEGVIRITCR